MQQPIVATENLSKHYAVGNRRLTVLNRITIAIEPGLFAAVTGTSGSGKTTLLSLLSGLDRPSSGTIMLAGRDITDLPESSLAPMRNQTIGFVFQAFHLVPSLNALENIMFPAQLRGDPEARDRAAVLIRRVGLWERRLNLPEQLSGGEKQRVAICRALINRPQLVFADEPTGNLDSENSREVIELLLELRREYRATLIMATHSRELSELADLVFNLHDGELVTGEQAA